MKIVDWIRWNGKNLDFVDEFLNNYEHSIIELDNSNGIIAEWERANGSWFNIPLNDYIFVEEFNGKNFIRYISDVEFDRILMDNTFETEEGFGEWFDGEQKPGEGYAKHSPVKCIHSTEDGVCLRLSGAQCDYGYVVEYCVKGPCHDFKDVNDVEDGEYESC